MVHFFSKCTERYNAVLEMESHMIRFTLHNTEDAPDGSSDLLVGVEKKFGFVPNLTRVLAEAPAALEAYLSLGAVLENSSLTAAEQQVAILATSFENECAYCMSAHTGIARMLKVPEPVVEALRAGETLPDPRLQSLAAFTRKVVRQRGHVSATDVDSFLAAGFDRRQLLEVLVAVTMKTLSNYTNHLADTPLDAAFADHAWAPASVETAA